MIFIHIRNISLPKMNEVCMKSKINALCCVYVHRESSSILDVYSNLDKNFSEISPFSTL